MRQPPPPVRPPRRRPLADARPRDLLGQVRDAADGAQAIDILTDVVEGVGSAAGAVVDAVGALSDLAP